MAESMIRTVRVETRTGAQEVRISLPRVDMLLAEHPDRYTTPEDLKPPDVAAKSKSGPRGKWDR